MTGDALQGWGQVDGLDKQGRPRRMTRGKQQESDLGRCLGRQAAVWGWLMPVTGVKLELQYPYRLLDGGVRVCLLSVYSSFVTRTKYEYLYSVGSREGPLAAASMR